METYDALNVVRQLRQTLATDKLSLGFLLGAGASCSVRVPDGVSGTRPLIPDVKQLTAAIASQLRASPEHSASFETLHQGLLDDGKADPNIEVYLSRVRALSDVAGKSQARGLSEKALTDLDHAICSAVSSAVDCRLPSRTSPFHDLATFIGRHRTTKVELFTTNYDLLIEQALEESEVPFFDGFCGSERPFFDAHAIEADDLPARWVRLWKLHGSINWRLNGKLVCRTRDVAAGSELLIHPSHRKYDDSRRMPYLVMLDRLRAFLRPRDRPVCLFTIGYSFSDDHLNEVIADGVERNPRAVCIALLRSPLAKYAGARYLFTRHNNLTVYAKDRGVIGTHEYDWIVRPTADSAPLKGVFSFSAGPNDDPVPGSLELGDFQSLGTFLSTFPPVATGN